MPCVAFTDYNITCTDFGSKFPQNIGMKHPWHGVGLNAVGKVNTRAIQRCLARPDLCEGPGTTAICFSALTHITGQCQETKKLQRRC